MASTTGESSSRQSLVGQLDPFTFRASLRQMVRDAKNDDREFRQVAATRTDRVAAQFNDQGAAPDPAPR